MTRNDTNMSLELPNNVVPVGKLFSTVSATAGSVTEIIAPSQNLHGIIVRTLGVAIIISTAGAGINVFADTTAPTGIDDQSKRIVLQTTAEADAKNLMLPYQLYLYPGMGMWMGTAGNATTTISYDLVD